MITEIEIKARIYDLFAIINKAQQEISSLTVELKKLDSSKNDK